MTTNDRGRSRARVEQNGRDRVAQQMRVDALSDARLLGEAFDHRLYRAHRIKGVTVALKKVTLPRALQVGAQLLGRTQERENDAR
jgi:hypothetical protein